MLLILKGLADEKAKIVKKFNYLDKRYELKKLAIFVKSFTDFRLPYSDFGLPANAFHECKGNIKT
jgi:hypothetical protein